jgi:hypothetical protein
MSDILGQDSSISWSKWGFYPGWKDQFEKLISGVDSSTWSAMYGESWPKISYILNNKKKISIVYQKYPNVNYLKFVLNTIINMFYQWVKFFWSIFNNCLFAWIIFSIR